MIQQPKNSTFSKNGVKVNVKWSKNFSRKWEGNYKKAQKYLDQQVISDCEPYTPRKNRALIDSVTINSTIGSGLLTWKTDYARRHYYEKATFRGAPLRGNRWFERSKNSNKDKWIRGTGLYMK